jgi:MFS transporter, FHS family, Na+ dependent glucose transporter 1
MSRALAYFSGFVVLGLVIGALGPALPYFAQQTGVSLDGVGVLFPATGIGHLVGNALSARCYDLYPGHRILCGALAVLVVALLTVPRAPALWLLMLIFLVMGIAKGTLDSGGNTLVLWSYKETTARYLTALHFCFGVGAFLSPILLAQSMSRTGGIAQGYGLLACCAALVLLWYTRLPSPVAPSRTIDEQQDGADRRFVVLLAVFLFFYTGTEVAFGGWIFVYAAVHRSSGLEAAGYLTSSFWGALTLTRLAAMPLLRRRRSYRALVTALLICLCSAAVLSAVATDASLWAGTIGLGAGMAIIFPMAMTLVHQTGRVSGRTIGQLGVGASLGAMIVPWLVGRLSRSIGPEVLLWFPLPALSLALAVLLALGSGNGRQTARLAE